MAKRDTPEHAHLLITELQPHPLQCEYYSDADSGNEAALRADIKRNGQRDPVVVLPEGNAAGFPAFTILDGHRRLAILRDLGHDHVDVLIRHDLADASAAAVEAVFLGFNFVRRQLHPLDKARIALRIYELEKGRPARQFWGRDAQQAMERVAQATGMTGRNLRRYFRVIELPRSLQVAVRDGAIRLTDGEKIAGLNPNTQQEIADAVESAEDRPAIRHAVEQHLGAKDERHRKPGDAFGGFVRAMRRGLDDLDGRVDKVGARLIVRDLKTLQQAHQVIGQLVAKAGDGGHAAQPNVEEPSDA